MWYKIAEVNGLTAESQLIEGMPLLIPVGVVRSSNTAETFKPYDPLEVLGSTSPYLAQATEKQVRDDGADPARRHRGGGHNLDGRSDGRRVGRNRQRRRTQRRVHWRDGGRFSSVGRRKLGDGDNFGRLRSWGERGGGCGHDAHRRWRNRCRAIGAAVGSIVSQGVGVMTGIQEKFSWNAVGLAAIGGGFGAGGKLGVGGSQWHSVAARAMVANALTQGIGVATGLQKEFSWAGVAAAGVGVAVRANFNVASPFNAVNSAAQMIADAATRSLIDGTDFGDNMIAALPNVLGQTIGEAIAGSMTGRGASRTGTRSTSKNTDSGTWADSKEGRLAEAQLEELVENALADAVERRSGDQEGEARLQDAQFRVGDLPLPELDPRQLLRDQLERVREAVAQRVAEGVSREAGEYYTDRLAEIEARVNSTLNAWADSSRGSQSRGMAAGEESLVRQAFGDRVNLGDVAFIDGAGTNPAAWVALYVSGASAITLGNNVFFHPDYYVSDFSTGQSNVNLLLHELTHVRQYQSLGFAGFLDRYNEEFESQGRDAGKMYEYASRDRGSTLSTYGGEMLEGQAAIVGDYAELLYRRVPVTDPTRLELERRLRGTGIYGLR